MSGRTKKKNLDESVTFRVPSRVVKFIEDLADISIYGTTKSEVLRNIVLDTMNRISQEELVRKTLESRDLARKQ